MTWDSLGIVQTAIQSMNKTDRQYREGPQECRDAMAKVKEFNGITGKMTFTEDGDPIKCAVIVKISDKGEYEFYKSVCP